MTIKIDWKALAEKYADPLAAIDLADFAEATAEDVLKFRTDLHGGMFYAPSSGVVTSRADDGEGDGGEKALKGREFDYVMSTEKPVGQFGDVILVKGWQLQDFRKRGGPFLFAHNFDEQLPPIGKVGSVKKDLVGTKKTGPFLGGRAQFTPPGLNPFNDLISDAVKSGFMPGGSVGFRMVNPRAPTDEELEGDKKLGKFSFISEKTTLIEFSAVPVGMDPDAVTKRAAALGNLEALLVQWIEEGRYEDDVVAEFRRLMGGATLDPSGNKVHSFASWDPKVHGEMLIPMPVSVKEPVGDNARTFDHLDDEDVARIDADGVDAEMVDDILSEVRELRSVVEDAVSMLSDVEALRAEVADQRTELETATAELQEARALIESLFGGSEEGDSTADDSNGRAEESNDPYGAIFDMSKDELRAFIKTG